MPSIPKIVSRNIPVSISVNNNGEIEFSFSSEYPCERWWGTEVLSHDDGAMNLERLSGMNFLWNHDPNVVLGRVMGIENRNKQGTCKVRWSNKDSVKEYRQDVEDSILTNVSFKYSIDDIKETKRGDIPEYRVTRWTPYEISLVSVPADPSVGIGRSLEETNGGIKLSELEIRERAIGDERVRIATINALSAKHGHPELAIALIESGKSIDEARTAYLDKISSSTLQEPVAQAVNPLGLSNKEQRQYSIVKAINAHVNNNWTKAGFERECSTEIGKRASKETNGFFVPVRDLKIEQRAPYAVGASATGGYTVETDLLAENFIDILRNHLLCKSLGCTMLTGLQGNVDIPGQSSTTTTYWVAENEAVTESEATFRQVPLRPKTIGALSEYTRQMLMQTSIDIEQFIRNDLAAQIALGIDSAALTGTGQNNQPTGILNTAGIGSVSLGTNGGVPTWDAIVRLETLVAINNAAMGKLAYATNTTTRGKLKTVLKNNVSGADYIWNVGNGEDEGSMNGRKARVSNQIPSNLTKGTGTNLSAIIFGNWLDLIIGEWGIFEVLPNPYGSGYSKGNVQIRALQTVDVALRRKESFSALTDAVTT